MSKIRIYEYAKQNNVTSKEIISMLDELGVSVNSHMAVIEDEDIEKLDVKIQGETSPTEDGDLPLVDEDEGLLEEKIKPRKFKKEERAPKKAKDVTKEKDINTTKNKKMQLTNHQLKYQRKLSIHYHLQLMGLLNY